MPKKPKYRRGLRDPRRSGIKWSIAAGLSLLVVSALVLSNARATSQTAHDGVALARAEAALGANDLAVKALGQAVLLAEDNALGVADDETLSLAVDEAAATLVELATRISELDDSLGAESPLIELGGAAAGSGEAVLEMIDSGRVDGAGAVLAGDGVRIAEIVTFLVALLLPLGAVVAYRYAARRQLRNAEAQLDTRLEAEREVVRAKDEFIGNISHELRTPLTSIFGFSELLLESGVVDPTAAMDLIGLINHESAELTRMVEDLLVSARVEANALVYKTQEVDIAEELESLMAIMKHTGASVDVLVADTQCWGDPVRVRQILRNLLSNAHRYGGDKVRFTARREGGMLEIVVADNGPGVPPEMEPRLFTRFVHGGKEALMTGSVGLGLSVVGSLVDDMGGIVAYENRDGWARFIVGLPVEAPPAAAYEDELDAKSAAQIEFLQSLRKHAAAPAEATVGDGG
jgi:signal transduction histidine kinase